LVGAGTFKRGFHKGITTLWELTKVVVPVYAVITFFKYTPVLDWIAGICAPFMQFLGLPGEASVVLVLGKLINLYAALGAITSLELSSREITILAVMLLLSHSLPMEGAVAQKAGGSGVFMTGIRIGVSIIAGLLMNLII